MSGKCIWILERSTGYVTILSRQYEKALTTYAIEQMVTDAETNIKMDDSSTIKI